MKDGLVPAAFLDYLKDEKKITFPWSMIDKITPRPHEKVKEMLAADGFDDNNYIETEKHTFTAPFVNAEEVQRTTIPTVVPHSISVALSTPRARLWIR